MPSERDPHRSPSPPDGQQQQPSAAAGVTSRTPTQIEGDLKYLREHMICEKLEYLVKQLLKHQPVDPVLHICSQLRERCASSRSSNSLRSSWNFKTSSSGALHPQGFGGAGGSEEDAVRGAGADDEAPTPPMHATSPTTSGAHALPGTGTASATTGHPAPVAVSSYSAAPLSSSLRTSRVTTPAAARPNTGGRGGGLERDESAKSDQSYFSIASVDMQEFLSEFRSARNEFLGPQCDLISRNELAEIVDRVNLPLPDVRLIADLFDEMIAKHAPLSGATTHRSDDESKVPFEAFLARMNYKIQGRYPTDIIRQVYLSMVHRPRSVEEEDHKNNASAVATLTDAPQRHNAIANKSPSALIRADDAAAARTAGVGAVPPNNSHSGAALAASRQHNHSDGHTEGTMTKGGGVRKQVVVEDGLWYGLGIRLPPAELNRLLHQLGIAQDDEGETLFQLTDFASLVVAATGQVRDEDL